MYANNYYRNDRIEVTAPGPDPHVWSTLPTTLQFCCVTRLTSVPGKLPEIMACTPKVSRSVSTCLLNGYHFSVGKTDKCIRGSWMTIFSWQGSRVAENREHVMGLAAEQLRCDWMQQRIRTSLPMTLSGPEQALSSSFRWQGIYCWQLSNWHITFCDHELSLQEV